MKATKATTIFSTGLLISFFLPWIDLNLYSLNGFEIPTSLDKLITVKQIFSNEDESIYLKLSYIIYLIPLLASINILMDILKSNFRTEIDEFFVAVIAVILLFILAISINDTLISTLSFGYYFTLVFGLLGMFTFKKNRKEVVELSPIITTEPLEGEAKELDKTNLLNQLSQLHNLKEKDIITNKIYEHERQIIVSKLESTQNIILEKVSTLESQTSNK